MPGPLWQVRDFLRDLRRKAELDTQVQDWRAEEERKRRERRRASRHGGVVPELRAGGEEGVAQSHPGAASPPGTSGPDAGAHFSGANPMYSGVGGAASASTGAGAAAGTGASSTIAAPGGAVVAGSAAGVGVGFGAAATPEGASLEENGMTPEQGA